MFTGESKREWAYRCLMRPPAPGAVPREGLIKVDGREGITISGHHYWGSVIYSRELTNKEIQNYELEETPLIVLD